MVGYSVGMDINQKHKKEQAIEVATNALRYGLADHDELLAVEMWAHRAGMTLAEVLAIAEKVAK